MSHPTKAPRDVVSAGSPDGRRLSVVGHLEELRSSLMVCALAIVVASAVSFAQAGRIIEWLKRPAGSALPTLAVFSPTEALSAYLKVAVVAGCFLSFPVIIYVCWSFIRPGLTKPEQRAALAWLVWGGVLFLAGAAFAYWVLLPVSLTVLLEIGRGTLTPVISLSHYLSFTTTLILACGAIFELPVAVFILARFGLVSPTFLQRQWRPAVLILLTISAIVTPTTDAATMLLMAAPLVALYGAAIFIARLANPETSDFDHMSQNYLKEKKVSQSGASRWSWLTLAGLATLLTLGYLFYRDEQAKIPRLSVDIVWQLAYVGDGRGIIPPRQDNVVTVPITVYNNSEVPALNLELNLLLSDGSGRDIDLNRELKKDGQGTNRLGRLDKPSPWHLSIAPSVNPDREQYKLGAFNCKAQVQLTWEDIRGNSYSQITLAQLRYSKPVETYPERFFWERMASYSSYGNRKERALLKRRWGFLPVQF